MEIVGVLVVAIALIVGMSLLYAIPVWWLWNWLCPMLFDLPVITFWQALGLTALCSFLFKNTSSSSSKQRLDK